MAINKQTTATIMKLLGINKLITKVSLTPMHYHQEKLAQAQVTIN